jgi:hypothetical protein
MLYWQPRKEIDFQILLVGEPHVGQRAMIDYGPWALRATTKDWRDQYPDFTRGVEASALGEAAYARHKVGFCDRSLNRFAGQHDRGYKDHIFHAAAICYNPCSPRESFELTWTKVCLVYAPFVMPQNNTHSVWRGIVNTSGYPKFAIFFPIRLLSSWSRWETANVMSYHLKKASGLQGNYMRRLFGVVLGLQRAPSMSLQGPLSSINTNSRSKLL